MTRVYVPTTLPDLARWHAAGAVEGAAECGVDRFLAGEDGEEGEYAALTEAAETSAGLVAGLADGRRRRVVVVAEVDDPERADDPVPLRRVVAVHLDSHDDADPDEDLAWYATQEIAHLI